MIEQLSMFDEPSEIYKMSLYEMRQHEWVVAWSGGKDSTATIIKMHEYGIPIKAINFVLMMWDEKTPAILPVMHDFVQKAKYTFEDWGYKVIISKSQKTAKSKALMTFKKSRFETLVGKPYGARAFLGGGVHSRRKRNSHSNRLGLIRNIKWLVMQVMRARGYIASQRKYKAFCGL